MQMKNEKGNHQQNFGNWLNRWENLILSEWRESQIIPDTPSPSKGLATGSPGASTKRQKGT